ncbi:MAG: hypothetical protein JNL58_29355 [Planctomyces sp.]|nr:hypothetical protein [Planctomyces sp.]
MTIEVSCQSCGKQYRVPDDRAGQRFKCKACEAVVEVPSGSGGGNDPWGQGDPFSGLSSSGPGYAQDPGYSDPYSAPAKPAAGQARSRGGKAAAQQKTMLPAIFLYILAGLSILIHAAGFVMVLMGGTANPFGPQGLAGGNDEALQVVTLARDGAGILCAILVIVGAYNLQQMKSYGLALTGAIVATIPCCLCFIFGMPFGIWALVVVNSSDVKPYFD